MPSSPYPPFLPPAPKPAFEALIRSLTGPLLRLGWDLRDVEMLPKDVERLAALRDQRALILANHPSLAEPGVMYDVLKQSGLRCNLLTAWDTLFGAGWFSARFFQWLGGYTIRRGRPDRSAMETTREILSGGGRVLAFPEGQTYGLNDTLIPFQEGLILIAFHALAEMRKQGVDAPLFLAPVAIKYVYLRPMAELINASFRRLEEELGLSHEALPRYARLRRVCSTYLDRLEKEEGLAPDGALGLDDRILRYRKAVVERLTPLWQAKLPKSGDFPDQVLALGNARDDVIEAALEAGKENPIPRGSRDQVTWRRLKTFLALRDGYVAEWPSAERYAHVLTRLELDLWGKVKLLAPQKAVIRLGEIRDLRTEAEAYQVDRRETLSRVTDRLEAEVRAALEPLWRATPPLPER